MGLFDFLKPVAEKTVAVSPIGITGDAIKGETPEMFTGDFYTSSDTKGNQLSEPFTAPFSGQVPFQSQLPDVPNPTENPFNMEDLETLLKGNQNSIIGEIAEGNFDVMNQINAGDNRILGALQTQNTGIMSALQNQNTGIMNAFQTQNIGLTNAIQNNTQGQNQFISSLFSSSNANLTSGFQNAIAQQTNSNNTNFASILQSQATQNANVSSLIGQKNQVLGQLGDIRGEFADQASDIREGFQTEVRALSTDLTAQNRQLLNQQIASQIQSMEADTGIIKTLGTTSQYLGDKVEDINDRVEDRINRTDDLVLRGFDTTNRAFDTVDNTLMQTNMAISNLNHNLQVAQLKSDMAFERIGEELEDTKNAVGQTGASIGSSFEGLTSTLLIIGGVAVGGFVFIGMSKKK